MNAPESREDSWESSHWAYEFARIAGEIYKIWNHPTVKATRKVLKVLNSPTPHWRLRLSDIDLAAETQKVGHMSDDELLRLFDWFEFRHQNDGTINMGLPMANAKFRVDINNGRAEVEHGRQMYDVETIHTVEESSPDFFRGVSDADRAKPWMFIKKGRIAWEDTISPFSFESDKDKDLAFMEYLIELGIIKPVNKPFYISLITSIVMKMPAELKNFALRNKEMVITSLLLRMNYMEFLGAPERFWVSRQELESLRASDKFLSERFMRPR